MLYTVYSTSNSDYQSWQCKLLEWSFKKVKQPGKLIRLCSFNTHSYDRKFDKSDISEIIKLPDYRTRWHDYTQSIDRDYGIVNKIESLKYWLKNYKGLEDSDNVLLIDPDMIFQKSIQIQTQEGIIIAQKWIDEGIHTSINFDKYGNHVRHKINQNTVFMYPYIATVGDLKKIVDTYSSKCYEMRIENYPHLWESEMFSLIIAAAENLTVKTITNLGLCVNWNQNSLLKDKNFVDDACILHYTSDIFDKKNIKLFNKQDYTRDTLTEHWKRINPNEASSYIEKKFLSILDNYNLSKLNNFYWNHYELIDSLTLYDYAKAKKYIVFRPWAGGFNNIRMSLEMAASIAYLTNRILVIPDAYKMYLLNNVNSLSDFFDIDDLGIKTISFNDFKKIFSIENWEDLSFIAYTIALKDDEQNTNAVYQIDNKKEITEQHFKDRKLIDLEKLSNENIIFFDSNLLGNFYSSIITEFIPELTKYVCRHIHYKEEIFNEAYKVIDYLGKQNYYSIHIRRGDFQYKDLIPDIETIYNNIKQIIPENSKIYIATDETDVKFFDVLSKHYTLYFYKDISHLIFENINEDLIGLIEQIICANATTFIGNKLSTFSSYIYRIRGYMEEIYDKRFLIYQSEYTDIKTEEPYWWIGSWGREYNTVFKEIKNVKHFNVNKKFVSNTIFVSIASYRDPQLTLTIDSILSNKSNANDVIIGVCMQDTLENFENFKYKNHPKVKTHFINYEDAKGVGWARNVIQQKIYTNEDYYLQIDSHSRLCKDWDTILINQLKNCKSEKSILSTYPNSFDPEDDTESYFNLKTCPYLKIEKILENNKIAACSAGIVEGESPILGFWIAAGFLFTKGTWAKEVIYSTDFYFTGEEDYLSVNSFENGWDVYVPNISTVWHNYTDTRIQSPKKYRPLHWEDHPVIQGNEHLIPNIYKDKPESIRKASEFLIRAKEISQYLEIKENQNSTEVIDSQNSTKATIKILFNWDKIYSPDINKNVKFIVFAFEDQYGAEIYRPDIYDVDIINRTKNLISIEMEKNIYNDAKKCIWFYGYDDGSFGYKIAFNLLKYENGFLVAP